MYFNKAHLGLLTQIFDWVRAEGELSESHLLDVKDSDPSAHEHRQTKLPSRVR